MNQHEDLIRIAAGALFLALCVLVQTVYDAPRRPRTAQHTLPATPVQGAPCAAAGVAGVRLAGGGGYGR